MKTVIKVFKLPLKSIKVIQLNGSFLYIYIFYRVSELPKTIKIATLNLPIPASYCTLEITA
jgi:hypothetical protein